MSDIMKLAIVTTHPIQYNAPWFKLLAAETEVDLKVFYTWEQSNRVEKFDPGFGKVVSWDIPLLDGYEYTFVKNTSNDPGSHYFNGIVNPTLNNEIELWGADAVLVFGWPFKSHLACIKYFHGKIPVLFRGDSTLLDEKQGVKKILRRLFLRYVYSFVDYALYVGTNNKKYFLAHGLKEKQLVFVPHAIDNKRFTENKEQYINEAVVWRKKLNISPDDFVVLFAGKFNNKKNPFFLLQLAQQLNDSYFKFVFVGNGELEQDLKTAVNDRRIIFLDFQNQSKMPVVYQLADLFVLPSVGPGETWGLAINEALASGKYVVTTTKAGGAVDLIVNNDNGLIIDTNDVVAAAEFIRNLAGNNKKGNFNDNKQLLEKYSFDNIVYQIKQLLLNLSN
ncbi:MAG: glycosyltransferase family 4 protein [Candidatus Kuenenia stuttgartiensis]|nr:glycosyltransferase family 4 protein [Candidatus Kuenenia stuttgartiensis]